MNEDFIKKVYEKIVDEGISIYRDLFDNTKNNNEIIDYWQQALTFYHLLNDENKEVFFSILKQTMIDTISGIFSVMDGTCTLDGDDYEVSVAINGISTDNCLQDDFLAFVEENQ